MNTLALSIGADYNLAQVELREFDNFANFAAFVQEQQPQGGEVGPYICGPMRNGHRSEAETQPTCLLALDFDKLPPEAPRRLCEAIDTAGWLAALWTTRSSTPEAPRVRVVFVLGRAVDKPDYGRVYRGVARHLAESTGLPLVADEACAKPEQPAVLPQPRSTLWTRTDGVPLDVDAFIEYDPGANGAEPRVRPTEPEVADDPILAAIASRGLYVRRIKAGKHAVTCPWESEHSKPSADSATAVMLPHYNGFAEHAFRCMHGHCSARTIFDLREFLGIEATRPEQPPLEAYAQDRELAGKPAKPKAPTPPRFNRATALIGDDIDHPQAPEFIVQGFLPRNVGGKIGMGGVGKSTHDLYEAVHIVLGDRPLYGYEILRPGPVLLLTAEDEREVLLWRLHLMARDMGLAASAINHLKRHLHIEDLTGEASRFVDVDQGGRLFRTQVVQELADEYRAAKLSAVFVDPQNAFGPGERFTNDGEAELIRAGAWLSRELNCAVRFDHHTGKANARGAVVDQYAGRGGSAGADNARFLHLLVEHQKDGDGYIAPRACSPEEVADGRVMRLHVPKISHGRRPTEPVWLRRTGFLFEQVHLTKTDPAEIERGQLGVLWTFIGDEAAKRVRHTRTSLESRLPDLGLTRLHCRALVHIAIERKHLVEVGLADDEKKKGARKSYLAQGVKP